MGIPFTHTAADRADANFFAALKSAGRVVTIEEAAGLAGVTPDEAADTIERLVMRHLVKVSRPLDAVGKPMALHVEVRGR